MEQEHIVLAILFYLAAIIVFILFVNIAVEEDKYREGQGFKLKCTKKWLLLNFLALVIAPITFCYIIINRFYHLVKWFIKLESK